MTYEELQKAYEAAMKKCSELEQKIEEKDLRIEHLTELVLKRNKMLFGQKSEKGRYINDGQLECLKVGRAYRVPKVCLFAYLFKNAQVSKKAGTDPRRKKSK